MHPPTIGVYVSLTLIITVGFNLARCAVRCCREKDHCVFFPPTLSRSPRLALLLGRTLVTGYFNNAHLKFLVTSPPARWKVP